MGANHITVQFKATQDTLWFPLLAPMCRSLSLLLPLPLSPVLLNDTWSQYGHLVLSMTIFFSVLAN